MQKEKASLRRDSETNLVRDFQSIAAFKTFFREKHLDMAHQFNLVVGRKPMEKWNVAFDQFQPIFRKELSPKLPPPPLLQSKNHPEM
jgi:hypothetical protein